MVVRLSWDDDFVNCRVIGGREDRVVERRARLVERKKKASHVVKARLN